MNRNENGGRGTITGRHQTLNENEMHVGGEAILG